MQDNFGFLVFEDFEEMDLVGPWEMIGIWSQYFEGPKNIFTINKNNDLVKGLHGLKIQPDYDYEHCPPLDFLLIPGGLGTRKVVFDTDLIAFIKKHVKNCQQILSVCTGSFLLQAAGLLQGKKVTSHWASIERLQKFPELTVVQERFVRDGIIWSSAGISAGIDLALAFIAEMASPEIAGKVQRYAEYYPLDKIYPPDGPVPPYVK